VREVEVLPAAALLELIKVHGEVTMVLVGRVEQTDVRLDGPSHARIFDPSGGVGENVTKRVCYLVEVVTLKLVRLVG